MLDASKGMSSAGPAVSAFQKKIRGGNIVLRDHICKQMNELNLERCRCIPKEVPGADWRCLEQLVAQDPAREMYKVGLVVMPNSSGYAQCSVANISQGLINSKAQMLMDHIIGLMLLSSVSGHEHVA